MKSSKYIVLFLGILILISSFIIDTKGKVPKRILFFNCENMKIVDNYINLYTKYGYSFKQLSPYAVKINNVSYQNRYTISEMDVVNNYLLILEK